jgi:transposase
MIQARWQCAPAAARTRGHLGNERLDQRWKTFTTHHKKPVVANVAIAREPAGWCWSLATLPDRAGPIDRSAGAWRRQREERPATAL